MRRFATVRDWFARLWPRTWGGPWSIPAALSIFKRSPPVWEFQKKARRHKRKVLALFEEMARPGVGQARISSPLMRHGAQSTVQDLLSIAEDHWVEDLCRLSRMFSHAFQDRLSGEAILNPTFRGSDDIVGKCLMEALLANDTNFVVRSGQGCPVVAISPPLTCEEASITGGQNRVSKPREAA